MQCWPEYGIGLVLTSDRKIGDKNEIEFLYEKMGYEDVYDLISSVENDEHTWRYYDADMDGKSFAPFADWKDFEEKPTDMLVIWAYGQMLPFVAVYDNQEEIRNEFIEAIGEYMPEDFDWDAHIGEFSVSVYR